MRGSGFFLADLERYSGQFTRISIDFFFSDPIKDNPSTPVLENSQERSCLLADRLQKNELLLIVWGINALINRYSQAVKVGICRIMQGTMEGPFA